MTQDCRRGSRRYRRHIDREIDSLPATPYNMSHQKGIKEFYQYYGENMNDYRAFNDMLRKFAGADCWAMQVNDEIIWNSYRHKSAKRRFLEDMRRCHFCAEKNTYTVPNGIGKEGKGSIVLYMFGLRPWRIQCDYRDDGFDVTCWRSKEYGFAYGTA